MFPFPEVRVRYEQVVGSRRIVVEKVLSRLRKNRLALRLRLYLGDDDIGYCSKHEKAGEDHFQHSADAGPAFPSMLRGALDGTPKPSFKTSS